MKPLKLILIAVIMYSIFKYDLLLFVLSLLVFGPVISLVVWGKEVCSHVDG